MSHAVDTPVVPVPWGIGASRIAASRLPRARAAAQPATRHQCLVILPIHSIPSLFSRKVLGTARGGGGKSQEQNKSGAAPALPRASPFPHTLHCEPPKTINTQIPPRDWPPSQVTKLQPCPAPPSGLLLRLRPQVAPAIAKLPTDSDTVELLVPADPFSLFQLALALASAKTLHPK